MALEEATRAISSQSDVLESLRTRTVTLVSVGALVFSLFTAQALSKHHVDLWIWLALVSFGFLAAGAVGVLWPTTFRFRNGIRDLLIEIDELKGAEAPPGQLRSAQRDWAYWANENYDQNQVKIDCRMKIYTAGLAALTAELVCLSLALVLH